MARALCSSRVLLPMPGITAQQHQGARHQATAQHPVQLAVATGQPLQRPIAHAWIGSERRGCGRGGGPGAAGGGPQAAVVGGSRPAPPGCSSCRSVAAPEELAGLGPTAAADVDGEGLGHGLAGGDV